MCVQDSHSRLLPTGLRAASLMKALTPTRCIKACQKEGFSFAGVQAGKECYCGNTAPPEDKIVDMMECSSPCSGDSSLKCGGVWRMGVFKTAGIMSQYIVGFNWSS